MTTNSSASTQQHSQPAAGFDISPTVRGMVIATGGAMIALCAFAIIRTLLGYAPELPHLRYLSIVIHVATVLPALPLGAYLLLARKGTARHKMLGKVWIALMVITATAAIFIHSGGSFSWIHIFVPITYCAAWKVVSSARAGDMKTHKGEIMGLFFGALMIPGIVAFAVPGRLMNVMLLG